MATSTIKNPHVPGSVIAESTGNKTISQHLAVLKTAYNALSAEERNLCSVIFGDEIYRVNTNRNAGSFYRVTGNSSSLYILIITLGTTPSMVQWTVKTSGNTLDDYSSDSSNVTVQLVCSI